MSDNNQIALQTNQRLEHGTSEVVIGSLKAITHVISEYYQIREEEQTKREIIQAQRDTVVAAIRSQRDIIVAYINSTFQERKSIFDKMFSNLDRAVKNGDTELIDKALSMILVTIKKSPFEDFIDFKNKLENENCVIEI